MLISGKSLENSSDCGLTAAIFCLLTRRASVPLRALRTTEIFTQAASGQPDSLARATRALVLFCGPGVHILPHPKEDSWFVQGTLNLEYGEATTSGRSAAPDDQRRTVGDAGRLATNGRRRRVDQYYRTLRSHYLVFYLSLAYSAR